MWCTRGAPKTADDAWTSTHTCRTWPQQTLETDVGQQRPEWHDTWTTLKTEASDELLTASDVCNSW